MSQNILRQLDEFLYSELAINSSEKPGVSNHYWESIYSHTVKYCYGKFLNLLCLFN